MSTERPPLAAPAGASASPMRGDRYLWGAYCALVIISGIEMFSASSLLTTSAASVSDPVFRHLRHLILGFLFILVAQNASRVAIRQWGRVLYGGGLLLLLLLPFLGTQMKGATRDIFGVQPVELIKLGVMMVLCELITASDHTFHRFHSFFRTDTERRRYWLMLFAVLVVAAPMAAQNLSSGLIIGFASLALMFLGKVRGSFLGRTVAVVAVVAAVGLAALYALHTHNESCRANHEPILTFSKPLHRAHIWADRVFDHSDVPLWEQDTSGDKAQEIYAHMALANSYPFGRFWGNSRMRDFLPEAYSDYIFAIIFEELGFVIALLVLLLYLWVLARSYWLSRRTENVYIRLLMVSLPLIMVIQALIHIGVCTGAMFVTGQPLPLISRGGSSIVFTSISFGLMFALSRIIESEAAQRAGALADAGGPGSDAASGGPTAGTPIGARVEMGTRVEGEGVRVGE